MWTVHNHTLSHSAGLPQLNPDTHFPMVHSVREKLSWGERAHQVKGPQYMSACTVCDHFEDSLSHSESTEPSYFQHV